MRRRWAVAGMMMLGMAMLAGATGSAPGLPDPAGCTPVCTPGHDLIAGAAQTPIRRDFSAPAALPAAHEIIVRGDNATDGEVTLVLRLDDGKSADYASRINDERVLPPGPFVLRWPTDGLRTPSKRRLDPADLRRLFLFTGNGQPAVRIDGVTVEAAFALPPGTLGLDFGPAGGAVFPGFESVAPGDARIERGRPAAVARPGGDALVGDGLRGVERFAQPWANGRWRVTLWTEDLGEWETLPYPLERRIRVNGVTLLRERLAPEEWIEQRYLAGRDIEPMPDPDPWRILGERRGGMVAGEVDVLDGRLVLDLAGDSLAATFLSGLLVEPAEGRAAEAVQSARAERFRETWRVADGAMAMDERKPDGPLVLAPGIGGRVDLTIIPVAADPVPRIDIEAPAGPGGTLPVRWWSGQWRLERIAAAATLLRPTADALRAETTLPLHAGLPRRFVVRVDVPEGTKPGLYRGRFQISTGGTIHHVPLEVEVLDVALPEAGLPIGFYLEAPPQFDWFRSLAGERRTAVACDLRTLRSYGLTGIAPPLITPDDGVNGDGGDGGTAGFVADMATAAAAGFRDPVLAYAPAKRLVAAMRPDGAAMRIAMAEEELQNHGLAAPAWSIADEPGNPDGGGAGGMAEISRAMRAASRNAKRAAHLNRPADATLLHLVDIALVNPGFGIDRTDIEIIRAKGVSPWIYNTGRPRLTAGFYLWRSEADGYLQWHARMPTADPFDPTDGRETDIGVLAPSAQACDPTPDIQADLLEMADGIADLRWLRWLDGRRDRMALDLRHRIWTAMPARWSEAAAMDADVLDGWVREIYDLARNRQ